MSLFVNIQMKIISVCLCVHGIVIFSILSQRDDVTWTWLYSAIDFVKIFRIHKICIQHGAWKQSRWEETKSILPHNLCLNESIFSPTKKMATFGRQENCETDIVTGASYPVNSTELPCKSASVLKMMHDESIQYTKGFFVTIQ